MLFPLTLCFTGVSQEISAIKGEPELSLIIPADSDLLFSLTFGSRHILGEKGGEELTTPINTEHLEITQFSQYLFDKNKTIAFGLRYRFRKGFVPSNGNEFRLIQEFSASQSTSFLEWDQRVRTEQRFRPDETTFRLRYQLEISKHLNKAFVAAFSTEALFSISETSKPTPEHRLELSVENSSFTEVELSFGAEFRSENFFSNSENEIYLLSGIKLQL